MKKKKHLLNKSRTIVCIAFIYSMPIFAQPNQALPKLAEGNSGLWYLMFLILFAGLVSAVFWLIKSKSVSRKGAGAGKIPGTFAFDEIQSLRKNQGLTDKQSRKGRKNLDLPQTSSILGKKNHNSAQLLKSGKKEDDLESAPLPIFNFEKIEPATPLAKLPLSSDEALISAIEQTQDEYEEDENVRELALKILAAFKTKNSVEALSQIAVYDLSSTLRSKAINVLADFDHESVFETILLGCADPTRGVRAAAARGMSRLSIDRTESWTRLLECEESGRVRQAARAAIEGGFVERSFDRLIDRDQKIAYEAFVLLALVLKAGEIDKLIGALKDHPQQKVRMAILHVLKVTKNPEALSPLYSLLETQKLNSALRAEIDKVISEMNLVTV